MITPVTRLKGIIKELLLYTRTAAERTADIQTRLGDQERTIASVHSRLGDQERTIASVHSRLGDQERTVASVHSRLGDQERTIASVHSRLDDHLHTATCMQANLANVPPALACLQGDLQQTQGLLVRVEAQLVLLNKGVANVQHALSARSWPDLFDPFATYEIARRAMDLGSLLAPAAVEGFQKVRVGHRFDGGYVMIDDWEGIAGAVSIGLGDNDAWDRAILARGIPVAQFDHTITGSVTVSPKVVWRRVGIGPADFGDLRTLRSIIGLADFPADADLVLKFDAEAAEWDALASGEAAPLERFRQMIIEFHWFDRVADDAWFATARRTISRIGGSHAPVHVHANNGVGMALLGGVCFPRVLEVTFVRRNAYSLKDSEEVFPTPLDAPNHSERPDHFLGTFRFSPNTVNR